MHPIQELKPAILQCLSYLLLTFQTSLWHPERSHRIFEIALPIPANHQLTGEGQTKTRLTLHLIDKDCKSIILHRKNKNFQHIQLKDMNTMQRIYTKVLINITQKYKEETNSWKK